MRVRGTFWRNWVSKNKKNKQKKKQHRSVNAPRPLLSLCVIARDEGVFLDACLTSVEGLVDEIVVVDTGSQDDTLDVTQRHGARVFSQTWQDDFSRARNRALEEARGKWVLVLDCDEVLARDDHARLRGLLKETGPGAYRMTTRNYSASANQAGWVACRGTYPEEKTYEGWFPSTKVRLWRHRRAVRFEGTVHELVEPSLLDTGVAIGDCLVPVHHYGHVEKERAADHYLQVGERKVEENPADLRAQYELAIAYRNAGRLSEALACIEIATQDVAAAADGARIYLDEELALLVRADILARLDRSAEGLVAYDEILARYSRSHQALNNKGILLEKEGRIGHARVCYERGIALAPDNRVLAENFQRLSTQRTLSVCIIARDEEKLIARCLESARAVGDQVVVVDTGSRDATVEIAQRYGATVGHFVWCDDFASARNASLELATGDWILWLDADDYLLPVDQEKVRRAKALVPDAGLYFTLVNEGGEETRFRQAKMFPNRKDIRFEQPVRESVLASMQRVGLELRSVDIEVRHTRAPDPQEIAHKQTYYAQVMERWLRDNPQDWEIHFRIGHTLYSMGERLEALHYFERTLVAKEEEILTSVRLLAATFTGRCFLEEGRYEEALAVLRQAYSMRQDDALALLSLGDVLVKLGQYEEAEGHLRAALTGWRDPHFSLDEKSVAYATQFFLGQALSGLGRQEQAGQALEAAAKIAPERTEARQALALLRQGIGQGDSGLYMKQQEQVPTAVDTVDKNAPLTHESKLTLCMIVRDEEERLGRCLDSVQGLVDEIVVVDTGSKDQTIKVAQERGARIGHFEWCDDFSAARNVSLSLATGDWIMWLDADDILPDECHVPIRRLVEGARDKAYFFVLDDQGYEQVSCLQMRLFPNLPSVQFEMPVHEQISPSLAKLGVEMTPTDIRVMHTGYTTPEVVEAKKTRYLGIMERWLEAHPEDYMERSHVALTYYSTDRLEEAVSAYRYIIEESRCYAERNWVVYATALLFLGRSYLKMDELEKAREYMLKAEGIDGDYILTKLSLAEVSARLEDHKKVIHYASAVVDSERQMTFFPIDYEEITYSAHLLCAQAHEALEQWLEVEAAYKSAAEVKVPRRSEALGSLSNLYKKLGQGTDARRALEAALAIDPENAQHLFNLGVLHLEAKEMDTAKAHFEKALLSQPNFALALLNMGYIAKAKGELGEAESIYRRAIDCDGEGVEARANLGHLFLEQERFAEAGVLFAQVRERQQGLLDIDLGYLLSLVQVPQRDWRACAELLRELKGRLGDWSAIPSDFATLPMAALRLGELGALLLRNNLHKCAELALFTAVVLDTSLVDVRRLLAEVLFGQGQYWKAVAHLEAVLVADSQDGQTFRRLGDCYQQLGVKEAAEMCYARSGGSGRG
jgi:glycosyltransferase involved in cell wall biosynthesis/lipopolysaccharide biosynthesis regulator YciM